MLTKEQIKAKIIHSILSEYFDDLENTVEDFTFSESKEESKSRFEALFDLINQYNSSNYELKDCYKLVSDEDGYHYGFLEDDYEEESSTLDDNDWNEEDDPLYGYGEDEE